MTFTKGDPLAIANGSKGGKAKVPKGFSSMDKDRLRELAKKGGQKSRRNKNVKKQTM